MTQVKNLEELRRTDPFAAGANLSLEAYPWLLPQPEVTEDEKFAPVDTRGMGIGSSGLKKFLSNPDRESVAELRDPETLKRFDEELGAGAIVYANGLQFHLKQHQGRWHARGKTSDGVEHRFTSSTRDGLFPKISAAVKQGTVHELTKTERLQIIRRAQSGDTEGAIFRYLELALGYERAAKFSDPYAMLSDPTLVDVFDDCTLLTWYATRNVQDTTELNDYIDEYAGDRPLTHALLDAAHESFTERSHRLIYAPPQETQQTKPESMDNLSDQEIERLLAKTAPGFVLAAQQSPRTYQKFPAAPADGGSLDQIDVAVAGRA